MNITIIIVAIPKRPDIIQYLTKRGQYTSFPKTEYCKYNTAVIMIQKLTGILQIQSSQLNLH